MNKKLWAIIILLVLAGALDFVTTVAMWNLQVEGGVFVESRSFYVPFGVTILFLGVVGLCFWLAEKTGDKWVNRVAWAVAVVLVAVAWTGGLSNLYMFLLHA
jgi:hypothetical protein